MAKITQSIEMINDLYAQRLGILLSMADAGSSERQIKQVFNNFLT